MQTTTVGLDTAKRIFQADGVDKHGKPTFQKTIKRPQLLTFFANLPRCLIGMEACASAHYWHRQLSALGHEVKLISPAYVKPYAKGQKNDVRDAEAICEAVSRPNMRFVPAKSIKQQDMQLIHRVRGRLVKQRTGLVNQIRGLLAEYGLIIPLGVAAVRRHVPLFLEDAENELTALSREVFADLYAQLRLLDEQIKHYEQRIQGLVKASPLCRQLMSMPGVGPVTASALVMSVGDAREFKNGRHMAAWLGLVPKQCSSGGKTRLLGISKHGDRYLRMLLVHGARTVAWSAQKRPAATNAWLRQLIERRGFNKACVGLANKMARQAWALLARGERYHIAHELC